jgi:hypothetical protein
VNNQFLKNAFALWRRGYKSITPTTHGDKSPIVKEWEKLAANPPDEYEIARWASLYPTAGIGYVYGGNEHVLGVDLDFLDEEKANRAFARTKSILVPSPLLRIGRYPKRLLLYRYNGPELPGKNFGGFELFYSSGQTILFGIHPHTGRSYEWALGDPREIGPSDLPEVSNEQILELINALRPLHEPKKRAGKLRTSRQVNPTFDIQHASDRLSGNVAHVLPELRIAEDPLLAAAELVAGAKSGSRYSTAFGTIIALVKFGYADVDISKAVIPVYADLFEDTADRQKHVKALETALVWARGEIGGDLKMLLENPAIQSLHASWATEAFDG